jgi:hypothetical protein
MPTAVMCDAASDGRLPAGGTGYVNTTDRRGRQLALANCLGGLDLGGAGHAG